MKCHSCEFVIDESMKFAITKNFCPKCGNEILSSMEVSAINSIKAEFMKTKVSKNIEPKDIMDISLFIYQQIFEGIGTSVYFDMVNKAIKAGILIRPENGIENNESFYDEHDDLTASNDDIENVMQTVRNVGPSKVSYDYIGSGGGHRYTADESQQAARSIPRTKTASIETQESYTSLYGEQGDSFSYDSDDEERLIRLKAQYEANKAKTGAAGAALLANQAMKINLHRGR